MSKLKEALKNQEDKGQGITVNPTYAMKQLMIKMKNDIDLALPKNLSSERFQKVSMSAFNNNEKLQNCEPTTFIAGMMQSAQLGLEPNTPLGQAYLIPHNLDGVDKV